MGQIAAQCIVCPEHGCAVTCTGDITKSFILTGLCPMGREERTVDVTPLDAGPGVHNPNKGLALARATEDPPEPGEEPPTPTASPVAQQQQGNGGPQAFPV
jgi:hypothetical protein